MDGVKVALGNRGMTVQAARQCAKDRKECRALGPDFRRVVMLRNGAVRTKQNLSTAIFAWHCVLSDRPPMLWWLSHGAGKEAVT